MMTKACANGQSSVMLRSILGSRPAGVSCSRRAAAPPVNGHAAFELSSLRENELAAGCSESRSSVLAGRVLHLRGSAQVEGQGGSPLFVGLGSPVAASSMLAMSWARCLGRDVLGDHAVADEEVLLRANMLGDRALGEAASRASREDPQGQQVAPIARFSDLAKFRIRCLRRTSGAAGGGRVAAHESV